MSSLMLLVVLACADKPEPEPVIEDSEDSEVVLPGPELLWSDILKDELGLCSANIYGYPVRTADAVVVAVSGDCTADHGHLVALDPDSGALMWDADIGGSGGGHVSGSPVYDAGLDMLFVTVAPDTLSRDDSLSAVRASTGEVVWREGGCANRSMSNTPLVASGTLYSTCVADGWSGVMSRIAATGDERWLTQNAVQVDENLTPVLDRASGVLVLAGLGGLQGFNAADGARIWHLEGRFVSLAALDGAVFATSQDGGFVSVQAADGAARWSITQPDCGFPGLQTEQGLLLELGCGDGGESGDEVAAIDPDSGADLWRTALGQRLAGQSSGATQPDFFFDDRAYWGTEDGFCSLSLADGGELSCVGSIGDHHDTCGSRPIIEAGRGYCADREDAKVMAFSLP